MTRVRRFAIVCGFAGAMLGQPGLSAAADADKSKPAEQLRVESVNVLMSQVGPVVMLKVRDKAIPIFVDLIVAESIQGALSGVKPKRPLTHDLMHAILEAYAGRVSQVVITLKDQIYYAALTLVIQDTTKVFDSRSSDAIALAIHFKAPILVSRDLLDSVGVEIEKKPGEIKL
ncbi:MAG: bifunctional nuclease family protein [Betaproteobacteria bacterium]|nr:bifunctional nuclease family protein [Betaproteobacteria bacterium]MBI2959018.1 bifunctional nuclease family protein [Betaproteobacteria bacterium]